MSKNTEKEYELNRVSAAWLKMCQMLGEQATANLMQLLSDESEWVGSNITHHDPTKRTCRDVLTQYGVYENSDYPRTPADPVYECVSANATNVQNMIAILKNHASWGEFLGGACESLPYLPQAEADEILPQLRETIKWASENGVDH